MGLVLGTWVILTCSDRFKTLSNAILLIFNTRSGAVIGK